MADKERLVRFEMLGQDFSFYTAAEEAEVDAVLALVREQLDEDELPRGTFPANKVAMMVCLKMALKYIKLENEFEAYKNKSSERFGKLAEEITTNLRPD